MPVYRLNFTEELRGGCCGPLLSLPQISDKNFTAECVREHNEAHSAVSPSSSKMLYMGQIQSALIMGGQVLRFKHFLQKFSFFLFLMFAVWFMYYSSNFPDHITCKPTELKKKFQTTKAPVLHNITLKDHTELPTPLSVCSFHSVLPEDVSELEFLKESIAWPETPSLPSNFSLNDTSDPAHSTFTIIPKDGGGSWHVGDQLKVLIKIADFHSRPKKSGGDVLLARLHSPTLHAGVAGQVVDHLNGSYTAVFSLLWEGSAQVEVTLVHPSEAVTVLQQITQEQPARISFKSIFGSGSVTETATCNVCLKSPPEQLCNFTDIRTGEPWFCYKPKKLKCEDRLDHSFEGFSQNLKPMEDKLFQREVNMKVFLQASGPSNITIFPKLKDLKETVFRNTSGGSDMTQPSGYYYQGTWQALESTTVHQFTNSSAISQCLKGKVLHLYGDSTIRQWFEYLLTSTEDLKKFDLKTAKQTGPFIALDYTKNTMVTFNCHAPPIRFGNLPVSLQHYVANELDNVVGGTDTAIVIGVWSHFSTFPVEVYIRRLLSIRKAVLRLLNRAPGTVIIIRTPNPKALTLYETLTNSDWFSLQQYKLLRIIFKGVNVKIVDAWEMTVAHHLPHNLHPQPPIIMNMVNVVLSHICGSEGKI
ncbi:PREDICTED: NXPE family member 3-like [Cyprinodon variegatus]|uniref:NXPE family member 3-like n=1 Tax=Cyprinodon variegatus TaxID=28743 RepID=UPI000742CBF6|nr:PREDICTED: NXPE family member 3-like [Cyprinodon variegatus]